MTAPNTVPLAAPAGLALARASDTGVRGDGLTRVAAPTVTGTAPAASTVSVSDGATALGTTVAAADGTWSLALPALADGTHGITATATDAAGNVSAASRPFALTIDTVAPQVTGATVTPDAPGPLAAGHSVLFAPILNEPIVPAHLGTGLPELVLGNGETAPYDPTAGAFRYVVRPGDDTADLTVTGFRSNGFVLADRAGNPLDLSRLVGQGAYHTGIAVDTTPPGIAAVQAVAVGAGAALAAGREVDITLTASEPISLDRSHGDPTLQLGTTAGGAARTAAYAGGGADGMTFRYLVAPGDDTADLCVTGLRLGGAAVADLAGNALDASGLAALAGSDTGLAVDTTAPVLAITSAGGLTNQAAQTVTGTADVADAGQTVAVLDTAAAAGGALGTATIGADGSWSAAVMLGGDGAHGLVAQATDLAGNVGTGAAVAYTLDTAAPVVTERLADDTSGGARTTRDPALVGTAEAGGTVTVLNGTATLGTAAVGADGSWSFAPILSDGGYTLTATETDAAGNTGTASLGFSLDATPPGASLAATDPTSGSTTGSEVHYLLTLSEPVSGLGTGSFRVDQSGSLSGAAVTGLAQRDPTHYAVTVSTGTSGNGALGLALPASGSGIADAAGNALAADVAGPAYSVVHAAAFSVQDTAAGRQQSLAGDSYTGPVAGLQHQYVDLSSDNLNVTATLPNSFIRTGSGMDAIDVSAVGGTNVLDGGTGSNFLVGGTGPGSQDTFFVDDRGASADIWSTVANFHQGDAATVWGVTPQDFALQWVNGQGAQGYTGLTLHATALGRPTASLTLSGYTTADLSNGRLTTSFGTVDGSDYLYIKGTG